ncbi:hypothetical protein DL96DRAFT_1820965 [Flagelloscypha sp. PMI_526]|nr:hypothetical protein DL96DRAFT_1820965 [Flagelloscypha sp. PMI_526]
MPTPKAGTLQQVDLETPHQENRLPSMSPLIVGIIVSTAVFCGYNIAACALGRFMLDNYHIWAWTIPSTASSIEKHAELIVAFVGSWLSTPATMGALVVYAKIDDVLVRRGSPSRVNDYALFWLYVLVTWTMLVVLGAAFHPRFVHVTAGSMLGVYGFGNLILLPALALFGGTVWGIWVFSGWWKN